MCRACDPRLVKRLTLLLCVVRRSIEIQIHVMEIAIALCLALVVCMHVVLFTGPLLNWLKDKAEAAQTWREERAEAKRPAWARVMRAELKKADGYVPPIASSAGLQSALGSISAACGGLQQVHAVACSCMRHQTQRLPHT